MELGPLLASEDTDFFAACGITKNPEDGRYARVSALDHLPLRNPCEFVRYVLACLTTSEEVEYTQTITIANPLGLCKNPENPTEKPAAIRAAIIDGLRLCSRIPSNSHLPADAISSIISAYLSAQSSKAPSLKIRHIVHVGDTRQDALIFCAQPILVEDGGEVEIKLDPMVKLYVLQSNTFIEDDPLDLDAF